MPKKDPTNIMVYHTSNNPTPPHVLAAHAEPFRRGYPRSGFHAGTINAALDRSFMMQRTHEQNYYEQMTQDQIEEDNDGPDFTTYLHTYQIKKRPSMMTFEDPHEDGYGDIEHPVAHTNLFDEYQTNMKVKEDSKTSINKYRNRWEDSGSTSYVIPHQLVSSGHVQHISTQQFNTDPGAEERDGGGYHAEAKEELGL